MIEIPWFEDFSVGDEFNEVPSVTITDGYAAIHQSVFADRSPLFIDLPLCQKVTGETRMLANPALVCNIAIGQSTIPSQRVMGNLFYRGLHFKRPVFIGDTLTTRTKVIGLKQNTVKPGRAASGMVALEIHVSNQKGETVLLFWRCPMIPCKNPDADTGLDDDFSIMPDAITDNEIQSCLPSWDLTALTSRRIEYPVGEAIVVEARDTVTSAPEIVRLTLNMAMTHTDAKRSVYDTRLVYGGHTISVAAAQLSRAIPNLASVLCWYKCDHLAPVFEEDILGSVVTVNEVIHLDNANILKLGVAVVAERGPLAPTAGQDIKVLDWQLAALVAI